MAIAKGQPILSNMLATSPDQITGRASGFLKIPQGFVAVTMPTSELQGVAGYIQADDYISILATLALRDYTRKDISQEYDMSQEPGMSQGYARGTH